MAVRADDVTIADFSQEPLRAVGVDEFRHLAGLLGNVIEIHGPRREGATAVGARLALEMGDDLSVES
jgi:hypothetical protein